MENSLTTRSNPDINGQNINIDKSLTKLNSSEINPNSKFFSVIDLNKQLFSSLNLQKSNSNGNNMQSPNNIRKIKSDKIKKFLANEEPSKPLTTIKEIVIDDQNEQMVDNNPKKRFAIKEQKTSNKKEKKKLSFLEELREFDRKQRISMEKYISNIKQKKFEWMYNKTLKNKYQEINYLNNINNGIYNQQEENDMENIYNTPPEKDIENKSNEDSFEKIKKKYFSNNIFSARFPKSEYKVKYLNNYFKKDSIVKNLFAEYKETQKEKKNINNEINNNNTTSPNNICNINFNTSLNNSNYKPSIKSNIKNNINEVKSPKIIFRNNSELNNMNNRYSNTNINEQSLNVNQYSTTSNIYKNYNIVNSPEKKEIDNKYDKILNSINEKLYKNKYKKQLNDIDNNDFVRISSSNINKTKSNINKFKSFFLDRNKDNNFFNGRTNSGYNNFKLTSHIFYRNANIPRIDFY